MQIKKINDNLYIACEAFSNSKNWGHRAVAIYKGREIASKKVFYQNRTWERYQFETVMACLIDVLDNQKIVPLADRLQAYNLIKA